MLARSTRGAPERKEWLSDGALAAGRYRLLSVLGQGAMGRVWVAQDVINGEKVALKELKVEGASKDSPDESLDVAFQQEFYTMSKLRHPNTVAVSDYGKLENGNKFFCMEIVEGENLSGLLKRGPLPFNKLHLVLGELAQVLGFIHSRLYVHCDIKSDNIRINRKGIKLMDFGLMHPLGTPSGGMLKGTPAYMAPEVAKGGIIDARTDLYSVGVLAFELAAGQYPFKGRTLTELISQHIEKPPPALSVYREVPPWLQAVVSKLLAKEPRDRYQDANELLADLTARSGMRVEIPSYTAQTSYLQSAELVGREKEQQALKDTLQRVKDGKGRSIFVTAPAGVGKTRLLEEFKLAVKLANIPFFLGACRAEGQAPMTPLAEALSGLLAIAPASGLEKHGPHLTPLMPQLVRMGVVPAPPAANPAAAKLRLSEALAGWLKEVAQAVPFVLCIEDLHWADSTTLELLNIVITELVGSRACVLGSYRSDEMGRFSVVHQSVEKGLADRLEVAPLSKESTRDLVTVMLRGAQLPEEFTGGLHSLTGGNPFYLAESLRMLVERQALRMEGARWTLVTPANDLGLPTTIDETVTARLSSLSPAVHELCRAVAPLGRILKLDLVRAVSQVPEAQLFPMLDELTSRQFVQRVEADYYFSHDLIRKAVYAAIPAEQKLSAHRAIGRAIEQLHLKNLESHWQALAYHYSRSDDADKAIHFLRLAGNRAISQNVLLEGTDLLAKAADLIEERGERGAGAQELVGLWSKLVEAGAIANPPVCSKFSEKLCTRLEERIGGAQGFTRFYETTRRLSEGRDVLGLRRRRLHRLWSDRPVSAAKSPIELVPQLVIARTLQINVSAVLGNMARAMEVSAALLQLNPVPGPLRAAATVSTSAGKMHLGVWGVQQQEALECVQAFERHLGSVGVMPRSLFRQYVMACYTAVNGQVLMGLSPNQEVFDRGLGLARSHGLLDWELTFFITRLARAAMVGEPKALTTEFGETNDFVRRLGNPRLSESRMWLVLPIYWLQRREAELAREAIAKLDGFATLLNDMWLRRHSQFLKALYAAEFEGWDRTEQELAAIEPLLKGIPGFLRGALISCLRARLLRARGDTPGAQAAAEDALRRATDKATANPWDEINALRTLGEVVGGSAGVEMATKSAALAQEHGLLVQRGISELAAAELALKVDRQRAATAVDTAQAIFTQIDCGAWQKQVAEFRKRAAS